MISDKRLKHFVELGKYKTTEETEMATELLAFRKLYTDLKSGDISDFVAYEYLRDFYESKYYLVQP